MNYKENISIVIDGVVGCGKSSLSDILSKELGIKLYEEPVIENPILPLFYNDKKRWSFALQIFFLNERFKMVKDAMNYDGSIMDRSIYGDVIFAKMLNEDGFMNDYEFKIYETLLFNMLEHISPPNLMVYLKTSVNRAINNINLRGRDYELSVDKKYWENLHKHYELFFECYTISPLLEIDVTELDFVNNDYDRDTVIGLIKDKISKL